MCLVAPESRKGHALPGTRVRNGDEPSCRCWEPNLRVSSKFVFTAETSLTTAVLKGRLSNPVQPRAEERAHLGKVRAATPDASVSTLLLRWWKETIASCSWLPHTGLPRFS